jgi:hypothetical protein
MCKTAIPFKQYQTNTSHYKAYNSTKPFFLFRPRLHYRLVACIQFCIKSMGKARHHKARLFCLDTRAHWSHDSLLWYSGTNVQLSNVSSMTQHHELKRV